MYIHIGESNHGAIDRFGKLFHVETTFVCIFFFPLVPLRSLFVLDSMNPKVMIRVPLSWKSILIAWLRGLLATGIIMLGFTIAVVLLSGNWMNRKHEQVLMQAMVVLVLVLSVLYWLTHWFGRPARRSFADYAKLLAPFHPEIAHHFEESLAGSVDSFAEIPSKDDFS